MRELRNRSGLKEPLRELRSADDNNICRCSEICELQRNAPKRFQGLESIESVPRSRTGGKCSEIVY